MRRVTTVLLCEDLQHEVFVRRFLKRMGLPPRDLRVEKSSRGSAEQFVRERYPVELEALRKRHAATLLIVVIDGDAEGPQKRRKRLADACEASNVRSAGEDERVVILVPTWNIETWFAYADGETVDETKRDYPRLDGESDCQRHVETLAEMCERRQLREPAPASLRDACVEYRRAL